VDSERGRKLLQTLLPVQRATGPCGSRPALL